MYVNQLGLWKHCETVPGQRQTCTSYSDTHGIAMLPGLLILQRALMVLACGIGCFAVASAVASTDCLNTGKQYCIDYIVTISKSENGKRKEVNWNSWGCFLLVNWWIYNISCFNRGI